MELVKYQFYLNCTSSILILIWYALFFNYFSTYLNGAIFIIGIFGCNLICCIIYSSFNKPCDKCSQRAEEIELDWGFYIAYSYFFGYLSIVLPNDGGKTKIGIQQRISDFLNYHGLENHKEVTPYKKLFILIPKSCIIYPLVKDCDNLIQEAGNLSELKIDRSGTSQRVYKNTMYTIKHEKNRSEPYLFLAMEYATPLPVLLDILKKLPIMFDNKALMKRTLLSFYENLCKLIKWDEQCTDACELIYYDDSLPNAEYNAIMNRISVLNKQTCNRRSHI